MEYQTFRGSDVKEALNAVRAALGPDALIESTAHIAGSRGRGFGGSYVEVRAAAPSGRSLQSPFSRDIERRTVQQATTSPRPRAQQQAREGRGTGGDHERLEAEVQELRRLLEELQSARPPRERAVTMLHELGIEGAFAKRIARGAPRSNRVGNGQLRRWLTERMESQVRIEGGLIQRPGPQLLACVGPTGVGKTTTLAKLAARLRLDLRRTVSVISLDTYRVGAVEQWQRYSTLMGIPFHVAQSKEGYQEALRSCRSDVVLVDTAGRIGEGAEAQGPDPRWLNLPGERERHVLLVVPAWVRAGDAERIGKSYGDLEPTGVVISKLDETDLAGGALHAAVPNELPVSYLCNGPRVPEDIRDASTEAVLRMVFPQTEA